MRSAFASITLAALACGSGAPAPGTSALEQGLDDGPAANDQSCGQHAANVKAEFTRAWQSARFEDKHANDATGPYPSCEQMYGDPDVCTCLSDTFCTDVVRPASPCTCTDPGFGPYAPTIWSAGWPLGPNIDPCRAEGQPLPVRIDHFAIYGVAWAHADTWRYKPAERYVFNYADGTVNEVFTEIQSSFHTALCGDGRAWVETWLSWVNPTYAETSICSSL